MGGKGGEEGVEVAAVGKWWYGKWEGGGGDEKGGKLHWG
jgi:hypothetical protein